MVTLLTVVPPCALVSIPHHPKCARHTAHALHQINANAKPVTLDPPVPQECALVSLTHLQVHARAMVLATFPMFAAVNQVLLVNCAKFQCALVSLQLTQQAYALVEAPVLETILAPVLQIGAEMHNALLVLQILLAPPVMKSVASKILLATIAVNVIKQHLPASVTHQRWKAFGMVPIVTSV